MKVRRLKIAELSPSDLLREDTFSFMISSKPSKLKALEMPYVLNVDRRLVIADGNHRVAALFGKGEREVYTVCTDLTREAMYSFYINLVLRRHDELEHLGIKSPEDLLVEYLTRNLDRNS